MIAGITKDELADLIAHFLPLSNEVAGFASGEDSGAMLGEQSEDSQGIGLFGTDLPRSNGLKGTGDAVEFRIDLEDNLLGPFNLIGRSCKFIRNCERGTDGRGRAGFGYGGLLWKNRTSLT